MSENNHTDPQKYLGMIEALLFVAPEPVHPQQLAEALSLSMNDVETCLRALDEEYQNERGLRLQWHAGRVQLTTAPQFSETIERFLGLEATARLSRAALETLAIIAYRQPVTRPAIDAIRGVNSDGVVKSLLGKGLIQEVGRADGPGRPILYGTTGEFLQHFGLGSIQDLPPYDVPNEDETLNVENGILKD
uniref:Segregation and condensation protein B n=1 Tax=Anaerolinea thermolimosa TaxID=229919 RepID=A0A7C4KJS4_9CHLR